MKKIVELKRERIEKNIEMKYLSDEQIRIINLNTKGKYEVHKCETNEIEVLYQLPPQEEWWRSSDRQNIPSNPVYEKAGSVIHELDQRWFSLPSCSEEESRNLEQQLKSCPDFSSKLMLGGLIYSLRDENNPIQKASATALKNSNVARDYVLKLVKKFEDRAMTEKEYNELLNCSADELVELAFADKYSFLNNPDLYKIAVEKGSTLELTLKEFKELVPESSFSYSDFDRHMRRAMKGKQPSADEIYNFSILIAQYQDASLFSTLAGSFLRYLVEKCAEDKIKITTKHLKDLPAGFTFNKRKEVEILGNMGHSTGLGMRYGKLSVSGNVGSHAGFHQNSGSIIINGDCGDHLGYMKHGGSITVNGNAGKDIGNLMDGGNIYLNGDYRSINIGGDFYIKKRLEIKRGGRVYHQGNLIVEAGKKVCRFTDKRKFTNDD